MAGRKPRKTIGNNPLDDIAAVEPASVAVKRPAAARSSVKQGRPAATAGAARAASAPPAGNRSRSQAATPQPTPAGKPAEQLASGPSPRARPAQASKATSVGEGKPATAEALFAAECGSAARSRSRDLVVVPTPKNPRHEQAMAIVKNWSQWSIAAGVVPVPLLDTVAISGVQLKMVHALCKHYGVQFEREAVLAIVGSLVGGAITTSLTDAVTHMVLKSIPFAEQILQPTLSFATTYSLGFVFVKHFENNGTLKDFKPGSMRGVFTEQLEQAKRLFSLRKTRTAG